MIKIYCDECGKEMKDENFVEQSVLLHYDIENSGEGIFCKNCWEKEFDKNRLNFESWIYKNKKRKVFKQGEVK